MAKCRSESSPTLPYLRGFFLKVATFYPKINLCMYLEPKPHRKSYTYALKSCIGVLYSLIHFCKETELAMFQNIWFGVGSLLLLTIKAFI